MLARARGGHAQAGGGSKLPVSPVQSNFIPRHVASSGELPSGGTNGHARTDVGRKMVERFRCAQTAGTHGPVAPRSWPLVPLASNFDRRAIR
jgi:hypothetical protein